MKVKSFKLIVHSYLTQGMAPSDSLSARQG